MTSSSSKFTAEMLLQDIVRMKEVGKNPAFFFDFDGTLTNIVRTPEDVRLKQIVRDIIEGLAVRFPVGIISGRKLDEIRRLVGIKGIFYSGNHGVEIEGPGVKFVEPRSAKSSTYLASLSKKIEGRLKPFGARINSKNYSVSIHYRTVEPLMVKGLLAELDRVIGESLREGKIDVFHGKKVVEIKAPVDWDKGKAIDMILQRTGRRGKPIFFGDDTTDEFGFKEVNALGGTSVFVGKKHRKTAAKFWVESPSALIGELAKFLFLST